MAKRLRDEQQDQYALDENLDAEYHESKYSMLDGTSEAGTGTMSCLLPPHKPLRFATYNQYEKHMQDIHTHQCSECHAVFPSGHFFDLHTTEMHDPIVALRRDAGEKTYACFVEDCGKVCLEWQKRRRHLVHKHGFPSNYDFFIVTHGIAGR